MIAYINIAHSQDIYWIDELIKLQGDGWVYGWMDGWMDGWMTGGMDDGREGGMRDERDWFMNDMIGGGRDASDEERGGGRTI